jgi:hypothetical protein
MISGIVYTSTFQLTIGIWPLHCLVWQESRLQQQNFRGLHMIFSVVEEVRVNSEYLQVSPRNYG